MPARRMPGTGVPSWRAMARPVAPAPIMATRMGRPSAARRPSAVSIVMTKLEGSWARKQGPAKVLVRQGARRQGPLDVYGRVIVPQSPDRGRRVHRGGEVEDFRPGLKGLVAVGAHRRHV